MRIRTKIKGLIALAKIKRAMKRGVMPKNSSKLYRAIYKAGLAKR